RIGPSPAGGAGTFFHDCSRRSSGFRLPGSSGALGGRGSPVCGSGLGGNFETSTGLRPLEQVADGACGGAQAAGDVIAPFVDDEPDASAHHCAGSDTPPHGAACGSDTGSGQGASNITTCARGDRFARVLTSGDVHANAARRDETTD